MTHTLEINGDKVIETCTTITEHDLNTYIQNLQNEILSITEGRDQYLNEINKRISLLQSKIDDCNKLK